MPSTAFSVEGLHALTSDTRGGGKQASLSIGKLFDKTGDRPTPSLH